MERSGLCGLWQDVTFESVKQRGLPNDNGIRHAFQVGEAYAKNRKENLPPILVGPPGTMKTTLAVCILRHILDKEAKTSCYFTRVSALFNSLAVMYSQGFYADAADTIEKAKNVNVLVLDDLGREDLSKKRVLYQLDDIISSRYDAMKPTIITSNWGVNDWTERYGAHIVDRLRVTNICLPMLGSSQRRK